MKYFALFFLVTIAFVSCSKVESQQVINSNLKTKTGSTEIETNRSAQNPLADLTKEQKQKLDERIPPKVREILDKAEEINIYYNVEEDTMRLRVLMFDTVPNAEAKVSDPALKKEFLESFYYDASSNSMGNACFSPRHKIAAKYKTKTVEMDICYQCSNFQGKSSSGSFGGGLAYESKSSPIVAAIIEKYGTKIK
jgi:hypothetical protein